MTRPQESERLKEVFAMVKRIHEVGSPYRRMDQQALQRARNNQVLEKRKIENTLDVATLAQSSEKSYGL